MIAMATLKRLMDRIETGSLEVTFPDGSTYKTSGKVGPSATLVIHNWRFVWRMLMKGNLGVAESYMDGDWSTAALSELVALGVANLDAFQTNRVLAALFGFVGFLTHRRNANTLKGSKRNIAFHYDLGNEFYETWLDPSMTYSSALFDEADTDTGASTDMNAAQIRKYRRLADRLHLAPGDRVLEIGCGWGGFAEVAARDYGAKVVGLTLSEEQKTYASARMERLGLGDQVEIRLQDYRLVEGEFDKIVSIEMFEAVGEENWPIYFKLLKDRLAPGGSAALQVITIDENLFQSYRRRMDFIQAYIFPGGMLPSQEALTREITRQGLTLTDRHLFGISYAKTLQVWRDRFTAAWPQISKLGFDQRFKRMWLFYLCYCEGGFRAGRINVGHFMLTKDSLPVPAS